MLANRATPRIVKMYERLGYTLKYLTGPRLISCTGDRTPAKEVLAIRNVRLPESTQRVKRRRALPRVATFI